MRQCPDAAFSGMGLGSYLEDPVLAPPYARHAMAVVLCGGRGGRLMELTDHNPKSAVPFGGKSRIIDFALSNAINSGIRRIAVATQYKAHSLISHLHPRDAVELLREQAGHGHGLGRPNDLLLRLGQVSGEALIPSGT